MTVYPEVLLSFLSKLYSHKTLRYVVGVFIIVFSLFYTSLSVQAADFEFTWKDHNTIDVDNIGDFSARTDKNAVVGSNFPSEYFSPKSFADGACSEMIASIDSEWRMYYPINSTSNNGACGFDSYATVSFSNDRPAATGDEPDPDEQATKDKEALKMLEVCPNLADAGGVIQIKGLDNKTYAALKKNVLGDNPDCDKALKLLDGSEFPTDDQGDTETFEEGTSCAVEGIGWIVCPVMNFIGELNDKAYGFLSNTFLQLDPGLLGDDAETAWKSFRDIANVLFVIAFLIIIYSQITGAGLSNYGLKKMLPKLIIAAILVNVSFILCKVAVDISNIVGNSIPSFFDVTFSTNAEGTPTTANSDMPLWKDVIGATLIAGTAVVGLVLVLSLGLPGLLALVVIVLILVARKAAIILLVVISPIAFVAYLLPNTEQWFKKWWKLFSSLLILYPIIGIVFGASALAAKIINNNGDILMQLTALGVSVLPLFAVPLLLKGSLSTLGTIGAKLSGLSDKANRAASGNSKKKYENSAFAQGLAQRKSAKQKYKQGKLAEAMADPSSASWYNRRRARMARGVTGRSYTNAGDYAQELMTNSAIVEADKIYDEGVKGASLRQYSMPNNEVAVLAATGKDASGRVLTEYEHAAAVERIMKTGSFDERRATLEHLASNKKTTSAALRSRAVQGAIGRGDQNIYGVDFANQLMSETGSINSAKDLKNAAVKNAAGGKVSGEHLLQSEGATSYLVGSLKETSADAEASDELRNLANNGIDRVKSEARKLEANPTTASRATRAIKEQLLKL